jgi:sugar phosphate isomerase/epimerase
MDEKLSIIMIRSFLALLIFTTLTFAANPSPRDPFAPENLVAWCIVPFDAKKRGPEERAQMLDQLGIKRFAYDYRAEHIPTFQAEMDAVKTHGIELVAWWFPTTLNDEARSILGVIERNGLHPQLWVMGGGDAVHSPEEQTRRVEAEADRIRPIAEAAAKIGCKVALYNHGGWFGDPGNQVMILAKLQMPNVGIVYNFHHGHADIDRFPGLWKRIQPHVLALNVNGMVKNGDQNGKMILPVGSGDEELAMLRVVRDSGWFGPVGVLNHTDDDAEPRLKGNLEGLAKLRVMLNDGQ